MDVIAEQQICKPHLVKPCGVSCCCPQCTSLLTLSKGLLDIPWTLQSHKGDGMGAVIGTGSLLAPCCSMSELQQV